MRSSAEHPLPSKRAATQTTHMPTVYPECIAKGPPADIRLTHVSLVSTGLTPVKQNDSDNIQITNAEFSSLLLASVKHSASIGYNCDYKNQWKTTTDSRGREDHPHFYFFHNPITPSYSFPSKMMVSDNFIFIVKSIRHVVHDSLTVMLKIKNNHPLEIAKEYTV